MKSLFQIIHILQLLSICVHSAAFSYANTFFYRQIQINKKLKKCMRILSYANSTISSVLPSYTNTIAKSASCHLHSLQNFRFDELCVPIFMCIYMAVFYREACIATSTDKVITVPSEEIILLPNLDKQKLSAVPP